MSSHDPNPDDVNMDDSNTPQGGVSMDYMIRNLAAILHQLGTGANINSQVIAGLTHDAEKHNYITASLSRTRNRFLRNQWKDFVLVCKNDLPSSSIKTRQKSFYLPIKSY